jgi:hypothetical protein
MVLISGEGMMTSTSQLNDFELVPGVFRLVKEKIDNSEKDDINHIPFDIDTEHLKGLVGFDTNNIRRPGLSLTLEVSDAQKDYIKRISDSLKLAFASSTERNIRVGADENTATAGNGTFAINND